jgi:hypothetical protein
MGVAVAIPFAPVIDASRDGRYFPSAWSTRLRKTLGSFLAFAREKRLISCLSLVTSYEISLRRPRYLLPVAALRFFIASNVSCVR